MAEIAKSHGRASDIEILRSALTVARSVAAREVKVGEHAIELVDGLGRRRELLRFSKATGIANAAALRKELDRGEYRSDNWRDDSIVISGHGNWNFHAETEDGFGLKPKKPKPVCLEQVFDIAEPDVLASLRSLYRKGGFDVFFVVEGDTRVRDVAAAMVAERSLLGLATEVSVPVDGGRWAWGQQTADEQRGPTYFDGEAGIPGQLWAIGVAGGRDYVKEFLDDDGGPETRVRIVPASQYEISRFMRGASVKLDEKKRPAVIVGVALEKSRPVARVRMSSSLSKEAAMEAGFDNAPWDVYAEKKTARLKARPTHPKTWHPTTAAVAEAYLDREAPRGYVSGKPIYFHGPVAFSLWDDNPIAALVDLPGGGTAIFYGRCKGLGGTLAGTVSSAQGDIKMANRGKGLVEYDVGSLSEFLSLGGKPLDGIAQGMRRDKNESEYPSSCKVDGRKLRGWLSRKQAEYEQDLEKAMKTSFATYTKSGTFRSLQRLAELRDSMASSFGFKLPGLGDAEGYKVNADTEEQAAHARQRELDRRRKEAAKAAKREAGGEEDVSAFRM